MNTYNVQAGDTLSILAPQLLGPGASWQDLWQHNPQITNPDRIEIGDVIFYPKSAAIEPILGPAAPARPTGEIWKSPVVLYSAAGAVVLIALAVFMPKRKSA